MSSSRQLAVIMFTDIVGYTAIMGHDEQRAFDLLKKNREIHKPIIETFHGKWIKELGDGILISFVSVTDAVNAAIKIQQDCNKERLFQLRIGIHLGDVIFENEDVFGDGVNIASRIQAIAPPGGIYVSDSVHQNILNKKDVAAKFVHDAALKNVKHPVKIFEVFSLVEETQKVQPLSVKPSRKNVSEKSIAVLPFTDLSAAKDQEYLGDGLAGELINHFTQFKDLKVIGRTSSFSFKGTQTDIRTIGNILNVKTILEGSIQKSGDKIRINARLLNAADGFHIWSHRYEQQMDDIFAIQDDIASKIAEHLKSTFLGEQTTSDERKPTANLQAYEMLLRGKIFLDKRVEGFTKAKECFSKAIELDPEYADAYYFLGMTYLTMGMYIVVPNKEGTRLAKECALKALAIDPEYPEAHILMASIYMCADRDWEKGKKEYAKAISYSGNDFFPDDFHKLSCWYNAFINDDFDYAISKAEEYLETDPLSAQNFLLVGMMYFYSRRYDKARKILEDLLEQFPGHSEAARYIGFCYYQQKDYPNALIHFRKAVEMSRGQGWSNIFLVWGLMKADKQDEALQVIQQLENSEYKHMIPALAWLCVYSAVGEMDTAFCYFEKSCEDRDFWLFTLKHGPEWDFMRADKRFDGFLERMNFPEKKVMVEY